MTALRAILAAAALAAATLGAATAPAAAGTPRPARPGAAPLQHHSRQYAAYAWARRQQGKPYCWGGTGGCFDCSGLVSTAYRHAGVSIGRATYDMLASRHLARIPAASARRGDLAFYGTGHVELVSSRHWTYGALHSGAPVGWHHVTGWWKPTAYYRVTGLPPAR